MLESCALEREIAKVYAPDAWFLKRGTTAPALRHALVGNAFTAARRRGKQIVLDTKDPDVRVGVHLGMSGRVLVDDVEAGDPLIYASNRRVPKWHRFGVYFADGGDFMLRDPRRLGAIELDPDESRLGPDALTADVQGARRRARRTHRADQGRAHGSAAHRRARATCSSTKRSSVPASSRPGPRQRSTTRPAAGCTARSDRPCARSPAAAAHTPATCRGSPTRPARATAHRSRVARLPAARRSRVPRTNTETRRSAPPEVVVAFRPMSTPTLLVVIM